MAERKHYAMHHVVRTHRSKVTKGTFPQEMSREIGIVRVAGTRMPRPIADQPRLTQRFRFKRTTAGITNVTADSLVNLMFIARGSSTGTKMFQFARLMKVEIWGDQAANPGLSPNTVGLLFYATNPDTGHQDETASFQDVGAYDRPAHICVRPGLLNGASHPYPSDTQNRWTVFSTSGQIGDIVDVVVEFSLCDPAKSAAGTLATASTTAGEIYHNANLDNTNTSGTQGLGYLTSLSTFMVAVGYG